MSVARKLAMRQNGGEPVEVSLGAEAKDVRMPNGEALPTAFEPPLNRAEQKTVPADADMVAITDGASLKTKRLTFMALKTWFKTYFDTLYLGGTGDGGDLKPSFAEATTRANIYSGLTLKVILGRIQKYFTDLKVVAFSGSYTDLTNTPTTMEPTAHAAAHGKSGPDPLTPEAIGALSAAARGVAGGVAPLGDDLKVPKEYLQTSEDALTFGETGGEAGKFDRLTTPPIATNPLRYNGTFRATKLYGVYFSDNADYAEAYQIKGQAKPGDLIAIGPKGVLQRNTTSLNPCVLGFVSEAPAALIGGKGTPIALMGRVPVNAVGLVRAGDFMAASATPGMVTPIPIDIAPRGSVVAIALEDKFDEAPGKVLAFMLRL